VKLIWLQFPWYQHWPEWALLTIVLESTFKGSKCGIVVTQVWHFAWSVHNCLRASIPAFHLVHYTGRRHSRIISMCKIPAGRKVRQHCIAIFQVNPTSLHSHQHPTEAIHNPPCNIPLVHCRHNQDLAQSSFPLAVALYFLERWMVSSTHAQDILDVSTQTSHLSGLQTLDRHLVRRHDAHFFHICSGSRRKKRRLICESRRGTAHYNARSHEGDWCTDVLTFCMQNSVWRWVYYNKYS
jgi:hypothetical protein